MANNILDNVKKLVGIIDKMESVSIEDDDKTLIKKIKFRVEESEFLLKSKLHEWDDNMKLFDGKHWELAGVQIPSYKADTIINKFWAAIRSLVAFETDAKPEPEVESRIDPLDEGAEGIREGARKVKDSLSYRWDTLNIPNVLTEIYYDRYIFNDGFGMYFWNILEDDVDFEQLKPREVLRSPGSTSIEDSEYIIVQKWRAKNWFEYNYPDKIKKVKFQNYKEIVSTETAGLYDTEKSERENMALVEHYFEDDIWVIRCGDVILEKKMNPFFEWRTETEQQEDMREKFGENWFETFSNWKPIKNHFIKPEKPIIQFKGYHLGGEFYSKDLPSK